MERVCGVLALNWVAAQSEHAGPGMGGATRCGLGGGFGTLLPWNSTASSDVLRRSPEDGTSGRGTTKTRWREIPDAGLQLLRSECFLLMAFAVQSLNNSKCLLASQQSPT